MKTKANAEDIGARKRRKRTKADSVPEFHLRSALGVAIERYRIEKGFGLNELARRAKVDPSQLSRIERGHQVTAHGSTLRKIAKALHVDIGHLTRLKEMARTHAWTTKDVDEILDEVGSERLAFAEGAVEKAIQHDEMISTELRQWLLKFVALARILSMCQTNR